MFLQLTIQSIEKREILFPNILQLTFDWSGTKGEQRGKVNDSSAQKM